GARCSWQTRRSAASSTRAPSSTTAPRSSFAGDNRRRAGALTERRDRPLQTYVERDGWTPSESIDRSRDVGLAPYWVVRGQRLVHQGRARAGERSDLLRQFEHCELAWIPEIDRVRFF